MTWHCFTRLARESGDFYEPRGRFNMRGLAKKFALGALCTNQSARSMLWAESEKVAGELKL